MTRSGYWDRGAWFLRRAIHDTRGDPLPVFAMIENRLRAGDDERAKEHAHKLFDTMPVPAIADILNALTGEYRSVPISVDMIRPVVEDAMICVLK